MSQILNAIGYHRPMRYSSRLFARILEIAVWVVLGLGLALSVASSDWIGAAMFFGVVGVGFLLVIDSKLIAMLWLIGQPTLFVFPNNIAASVPFFTLERALFLLLLGLMIVRMMTRSVEARPMSKLDRRALIFVGVLVVSFLTTIIDKDLKTIRGDLAFLLQCYLMPWLSILIARRLDWTETDVLRFLRLLTIAGLGLFGIGVLQFFLGIKWFTPTSFEVIHEGRTTGTFANAVEYGSVLAGIGLLTLAQLVTTQNLLLRLALLFSFGIMVGGIVICMTRSPLVGLALGLLIVFLGDRRIRPLIAAGGAFGVLAAAAVIPLVLDVDALLYRFSELEPIYNRVALFMTATNMIENFPVFGIGFGRHSFSDAKNAYLDGAGEIGAEWAAGIGVPHFEYIHVLVLCGTVGLICYILAFTACISTLRAIYRDPRATTFTRTTALYVLAMLASLLVNGLFVDFLAYNYFMSLVCFMVGMVSVMRVGPINYPALESEERSSLDNSTSDSNRIPAMS
ncbi:O-antigen ligase family protein [Microvirga guangxiensis]|uniref:O-antigen ligase n=1 Tax=Microvirga guangxiensis TaxID=549386 RepID=A0A1G5GZS4_9HYPH|nr:O-antigen ligase family protein [Microvirga guangxiensis]SCY56907.1 O-antigen ligase [Microvirga guangxiensis]